MSFRDAVLKASRQAIARLGEPVTLVDGSEILGIFIYPSEHSELVRGGRGSASATAIRVQGRNPALIVAWKKMREHSSGARG